METTLMSHFGRKVTLTAVAFAMAGSTVFGGVALADGKRDHHDKKDDKKVVKVDNRGGAGGAGGDATNNCLNVAVPIQALNIAGTTTSDVDQCFATGGAGGAGGAATIDS
jgi:hypothetical protein